MEQADFQVLRDARIIKHPLAVFLSGGDHGRRMLPDSLHYLVDVHLVVVVVVGEPEVPDDLVLVAEVHPQRSILGNAREQHQFLGISVPRIGLFEDRLQGIVPYRGEKQGLLRALPVGSTAGRDIIVLESEGLRPLGLLFVFQVSGAFGDDDHIRRMEALRKIPQPSEWQQFVLVGRAVVIHQDYIEISPEGPVLESVVQDYQVGRRYLGVGAVACTFLRLEFLRMAEYVASLDPVPVHCHSDGRELLLDLQGFIPIFLDGAIPLDYLEPLGVALVPPGQYGDIAVGPVVALQEGPEDHFGVRGLAGTAGGDVAYADRRDFTGSDLEYTVVVQGMPQFQSQVIWCKNDLVKHECKDTKNYRPFNYFTCHISRIRSLLNRTLPERCSI